MYRLVFVDLLSFQDLSTLEVIQKLIDAAGQRNMRIILDYHRMKPTQLGPYSPESGLWYDDENSVDDFSDNWNRLATAFKGQPTVVGVRFFFLNKQVLRSVDFIGKSYILVFVKVGDNKHIIH